MNPIEESKFKGNDLEGGSTNRCLCLLLLDHSGSMGCSIGNGKRRIDALNEGLQEFKKDILANDKTASQLEVAVVEFDHGVHVIQEPALTNEFEMPTLTPSGGTNIANGLRSAMQMVQDRKKFHDENGFKRYRSFIVLISDGEDGSVSSIATQTTADHNAKKYFLQPLAVSDDSKLDVLKTLSPAAQKLKDNKFSDFFKWLSISIGNIMENDPGESGGKFADPSEWLSSY
jgi:uncharacterized protein YegL